MKYIFLFFGAHDGSIVGQLDKLTNDNVYGENINWDEIHLFEPQTEHASALKALALNDKRVIYHNCAVSTENKEGTLYVKGSFGFCSSTIDQHKHAGRLHFTETVQIIDIVQWITENTSAEDYVCIDMDIECEEYNILPHIIESDIMDRIKFISVEFHEGKSHYWSQDGYDKQVRLFTYQRLGNKFLDHDTYYA